MFPYQLYGEDRCGARLVLVRGSSERDELMNLLDDVLHAQILCDAGFSTAEAGDGSASPVWGRRRVRVG